MSSFNLSGTASHKAPNPEALFRDLKKPGGIVHLWAHQADLLRAYESNDRDKGDVALELPTGSGKTLVGLLIGEWRRTALNERVAYLCPTRQLARQTADHAESYGIRVVTLIGSAALWPAADLAAFNAGRSIAISVYSHSFNSSPKLQSAQVLVLDDAHAGENFVANAWTIHVGRDEKTLFHALLNITSAGLDQSFVRAVSDDDADPTLRKQVRLVRPTVVAAVAEQLVEAIETHGDKQRFPLSMLRHHLDRCMMYVSWSSIEIRPFIPPTFAHPAFEAANQRVYMSATLGESGELERAFGRPQIHRLPVPPGWDRQGSGRRFIIFPEMGLLPSEVPHFVSEVIDEAGKAVVLCPDRVTLTSFEASCLPRGMVAMHADDVEEDLNTFAEAERATLLLTNRYDGIDLPDEACRLTVFAGQPVGTHLQERFLYEAVRATSVLEERVRTRIVQGAGRCTRNANDFAVVLAIDPALMNFWIQREVRNAMHPELQAETSFGFDNSEVGYTDLLDRVRLFLRQDGQWVEEVEPLIRQMRDGVEVAHSPEALALRESARREVLACDAAWRGDWPKVVLNVREVMEQLSGHDRLRPYKSLWAYMGAWWASLAATSDPTFQSVAAELEAESATIAKGMMWLAKLEGRFSPGDEDLDTSDVIRIDRAVDELVQVGWGTRRFENRVATITEGINGTEATAFEMALEQIGLLLGFDAERSDEQGDPDGVWRAGEELWITLEAKSEEGEAGEISLATVRQANTHLKWAKDRYGQPAPSGSYTVVISPRTGVASAARRVANPDLFATSLDAMRKLATDVITSWREVRAMGRGKDEAELRTLLGQSFWSHGLLSHRLRSRLRRLKVAGD